MSAQLREVAAAQGSTVQLTAKRSDIRVDQRQSNEDRLLDELSAAVPLADPDVVALVRELAAEISRLRTDSSATANVESLTELLLGQAAELQQLRDRLQRVRALVELSNWATGGSDSRIRASDILHAISGPVADRSDPRAD